MKIKVIICLLIIEFYGLSNVHSQQYSIKYISCDSLTYPDKTPGDDYCNCKDCHYMLIDGVLTRNFIHALSFFQYNSINTPLHNNKSNFYDSRITGAWYIDDPSYLMTITPSTNNSSPFKIRRYSYNKSTKRYSQDQENYPADMQNLFVTKVDTTYFLENSYRNSVYHLKSKKTEFCNYNISNQYYFIDDNTMVLNPISAEFVDSFRRFDSNEAYRDFISENIKNPNIFFHKIVFHRFFGQANLPEDKYEKSEKDANIGLTALLILGGLILTNDNPNYIDTHKTDKRQIDGYDSYWNPIYSGGVHTGGKMIYNERGERKD